MFVLCRCTWFKIKIYQLFIDVGVDEDVFVNVGDDVPLLIVDGGEEGDIFAKVGNVAVFVIVWR